MDSGCAWLCTGIHTCDDANDTAGGQQEVVHNSPLVRPHPVHMVIPIVSSSRHPNFSVLMSIVTWSYVCVRSFIKRWIFSTA